MVLGQSDRTLQVIAQGPTTDDAGLFNYLWSDQQRDLRRSPGFAAFARKVGFAVLWDRFGPPDGCRRKARSEYNCE
jgi:hypothetical protein